MKTILFSIFIFCLFAGGFRGCVSENEEMQNVVNALVFGFRYNNSDAGFIDRYYILAGAGGKIYRSTDPVSDPWIEKNSGTLNSINCLSNSVRSDTAVTFGAGDNGTIVRSLDQGMTWTVLNTSVSRDLNSISFIGSDINRLVAVGDSGLIIRTTNCGDNWQQVSSGVTKDLNSVFDANSFVLIAAGNAGTVLRSSNGGTSWENRSLEDSLTNLNKVGLMGTWFFGNILGIAGDNGRLYRSTNDFYFWQSIETGVSGDLHDLRFKNASSGYVTGDSGLIRYTIDGGVNWYSEFFLQSLTNERISSSLILNDTTVAGLAGREVIVLSAEESLLPVELASFHSEVDGSKVTLHWTTSSETNNSGFDIERMNVSESPFSEWSRIGNVEGSGNTNSPVNYSYADNNLFPGKYTYRLKQIDFNGGYEYFNLNNFITIGIPKGYHLFQNYPNPFNPVTKVRYEIPEQGNVSLKVYDIKGNEIKTLVNEFKTAGTYETVFDGNGLSSGIYFYRLKTDNFMETRKMILTK